MSTLRTEVLKDLRRKRDEVKVQRNMHLRNFNSEHANRCAHLIAEFDLEIEMIEAQAPLPAPMLLPVLSPGERYLIEKKGYSVEAARRTIEDMAEALSKMEH